MPSKRRGLKKSERTTEEATGRNRDQGAKKFHEVRFHGWRDWLSFSERSSDTSNASLDQRMCLRRGFKPSLDFWHWGLGLLVHDHTCVTRDAHFRNIKALDFHLQRNAVSDDFL